MNNLILASRSPRRIELLRLITTDFTVIPSNFDESAVKANTSHQLVTELSYNKALKVFSSHRNSVVIGCDTVVDLYGETLGIPFSREDAFSMLTKLSGKTHSVFTGVTVLYGEEKHQFIAQTDVTFLQITKERINSYLDTDEPYDKAGAYGIQGKGGLFVDYIKGDYFNVVGLPVARLYDVIDFINK